MTSNSTMNRDMAAIQEVPGRIVAAWARNDADAFAAVFTEDATLVLPDNVLLRSRKEIRDFMAAGFASTYKGTKVTGDPVNLHFATPDTAILVTSGGVLMPGETTVAPERAIRATWVVARQDDEWLLTAYQNTPIGTAG